MSRLQLVQNAAARFLLTGTKKRKHHSCTGLSLHWLPVKYRIDLKVLLFVLNALHGSAPSYISDLLSQHSSSRTLRSSNQLLLCVPPSRLNFKGDGASSVAAPKLWNG